MRYITAIRMGPGGKEEHISLCLCLNADTGKTITWNPKTIARKIDDGTPFQVGSKAGPVDVCPVHRRTDDDYIRTEADDEPTNNLLELPRF